MLKGGKFVLGAAWFLGFMFFMNKIVAPIGSADPTVHLAAPEVLPASTKAPTPTPVISSSTHDPSRAVALKTTTTVQSTELTGTTVAIASTPAPTVTPSPSEMPSVTPVPSSSPSPAPSPTPSTSPKASPTPSPSASPTPSPKPKPSPQASVVPAHTPKPLAPIPAINIDIRSILG
jgi:hypothetical protein